MCEFSENLLIIYGQGEAENRDPKYCWRLKGKHATSKNTA